MRTTVAEYLSWLRYDGDGQMIACIINFSSKPRPDHQIGLPTEGYGRRS